MEEKRIINIVANDKPLSQETERVVRHRLEKNGFIVPFEFDYEAELIIIIGGDGSFLRGLNKYNFPNIPVIGINTGHLGFFQEISPYQIDEFIFKYKKNDYVIQNLTGVSSRIHANNEDIELTAINEIVIRGDKSRTVHLNISLDDSFLERFSGDGILVSSASGSTAYNYALGGSIVDPRLNLLQITPLAPINTTAYRSFTSSVIVPPEITIKVNPEYTFENSILIIVDGFEYRFNDLTEISLSLAPSTAKLLRFSQYDFWNKVKSKFL